MMNYVNIWVQQPNSLLCRLISSYTNVQNELGLASTVCPFTQDVLFIVLYRFVPSEDLISLFADSFCIFFWRSKNTENWKGAVHEAQLFGNPTRIWGVSIEGNLRLNYFVYKVTLLFVTSFQ